MSYLLLRLDASPGDVVCWAWAEEACGGVKGEARAGGGRAGSR